MDQLAALTDRGEAGLLDLGEQTLQRVAVDRPAELRPLYWRSRHEGAAIGFREAALCPDGSILLQAATTVSFDTYFGGFFESHWRMNTSLQALSLVVSVSGSCLVRLRRRSIGVDRLLGEMRTEGGGTHTLRFPVADASGNFREYGLLYFEVTALADGARFVSSSWRGEAATRPVRMGIVLCTFNRESFIAAVLETMASDPALLQRLDRIIVVNQGRADLGHHTLIAPIAERLGTRLTIIEQGNFGGAGGFTRGMLETLDDPTLTHCAFLDDDIRLEPDTIPRLIAFLSLARDDVAVGGHMLDGVQPTRLYEGGAIIETRDWFPHPVQHDIDLVHHEGLDRLAQPHPVHFNGWWCFAVPLQIVRRLGLPMPCFIRGDDAEYGMRLYRAGVRTIPLPGAAVWHEPFYLKLGNWQLYYETRNLLILAALHDRFSAGAALRRVGRSFMTHLLTFRYYGARLILQGIADFLEGPGFLHRDPQPLHAMITGLRKRHGPEFAGRRQVLDHARIPRMPRRRIVFLFWFVILLLRNGLRPGDRGEPVIVGQGDFSWIGLRHIDNFALDNWWEPEMSVYRRDRSAFWELVRIAVPVVARLKRRGNRLAASWKAAAPELTSEPFWRGYLGCTLRGQKPRVPPQPCLTSRVEPASTGRRRAGDGTDEADGAHEAHEAHGADDGWRRMVAQGPGAAVE